MCQNREEKEKIEAELQRQLEAERQMAINLKEMKAAQYEADLAAHKRRQRMEELKAKQNRNVQEVAWEDVMAWNRKDTQAQREAKLEAMRIFDGNRALQLNSHDEEAAEAIRQLRAKEEAAQAERVKVKARTSRSSRSKRRPGSQRSRPETTRSPTNRAATSPTNKQKPPTWNWGHFGAFWSVEDYND